MNPEKKLKCGTQMAIKKINKYTHTKHIQDVVVSAVLSPDPSLTTTRAWHNELLLPHYESQEDGEERKGSSLIALLRISKWLNRESPVHLNPDPQHQPLDKVSLLKVLVLHS